MTKNIYHLILCFIDFHCIAKPTLLWQYFCHLFILFGILFTTVVRNDGLLGTSNAWATSVVLQERERERERTGKLLPFF